MAKKTVILKWNPAISSYGMIRFLSDICREESCSDWSIWEHEKVRCGDDCYMLKVGLGACGIVAKGRITSDPELDNDWREPDRKVFYCDYEMMFMVNPETLPILTAEELEKTIPDFDWRGGHAGVVLPQPQAGILQELFDRYLETHAEKFIERLERLEKRGWLNDQLYLETRLRASLEKRLPPPRA